MTRPSGLDGRRSTVDLRKHARSTQVRLALGGLALLFGVGGLLIYIFYGPAGATLAFLCFLIGLLPVVVIAVVLWIMEALLRRSHEQ